MFHVDYLHFLHRHLADRLNDPIFCRLLEAYTKEFVILVHLNLDPVLEILDSLYSSNHGAHRREPVCMLRSLLLMTTTKESSITKWVKLTRSSPLPAILSGFDPDDTPGIGTYYDFFKRIIDGPWQKPCEHRVKRSSLLPGRHLRNLKAEKDAKREEQNPHDSQSARLAEQLLAQSAKPRSNDFQKILEELLIRAGIVPSIEAGLLTDLQNLKVSGDGSTLESGASRLGKPSCTCRSEGIYRCDHPRYYSSPTAEWCYDSQRDTHVFGDRYYHLVVTQDGHDFPLLTIMPGGYESDYTLSLKTFDRFFKAARENDLEVRVHIFIGDGHHDSYAHYDYFKEKDVIPVIPLSQNSQKVYPHFLQDRGIQIDTDGTPLCPGGMRMRRHQYNKAKRSHVYVCPVKRNTSRGGKSIYITHADECPLDELCEPDMVIGPTIHIKADTDPRFYPPIARNSPKFKKIMNERSASERCNAVIDSYHLDRSCRNADYGLIRLYLVNIVEHAVVRYLEMSKEKSASQLVRETLDKILSNGYRDTG